MTEKTKGCKNPQDLKGKPGECSTEQIRKCHGEAKRHPCATKGGKRGKP